MTESTAVPLDSTEAGDDLFSLVDAYVAERLALRQFTRQSAESVLAVLRPFARYVDGDLDRFDRRSVTSWLAERDISPTTIKSNLTKLRPFARWLVAEGVLERDPVADIPIPRIPERLPRALPVDAVARVIDACPDTRARLIVLLMVQAGLRAGEVAAIEMRDIDTERRVLQVRGKGGHGEVTRAIPVADELWDALEAYLDEVGTRYSGPLITSQGNGAGTVGIQAHTISAMLRRWFSAAGVKVRAYDGMSGHALRHTAAQDVADSGADLRHVQELLGHRSIRTTQTYLRLQPPGLREAVLGRTYGDPELIAESRGPRVVVCPICERAFKNRQGLGRHMAARHGS